MGKVLAAQAHYLFRIAKNHLRRYDTLKLMRICYLADNFSKKYGNGRLAIKIIETAEKNIPNLAIEVLVTKNSGFRGEMSILYANKYKLLANFLKIRSVVKKSDLVHAIDGFPFGVIAALACWGTGTKFIITGIGSGAIQMFSHPYYRRLLKWAYRRAAAVTAISHFIADEIQKQLPGL